MASARAYPEHATAPFDWDQEWSRIKPGAMDQKGPKPLSALRPTIMDKHSIEIDPWKQFDELSSNCAETDLFLG
jgi:hypothetical protein